MPELSLQLYTVRAALAADFDGALAAIAAMGFTQVEPFRLVEYADELPDRASPAWPFRADHACEPAGG